MAVCGAERKAQPVVMRLALTNQIRGMRHPARRVAVCVLAVAGLITAGCTTSRPPGASTTTSRPQRATTTSTVHQTTTTTVKPTPQPLTAGQQGTRTQVPWHRIGRGWLLALWSPSPPPTPVATTTVTQAPVARSIFLLDPAGGRYLIADVPATTTGYMDAWSGDGRRAVLVDYGNTARAVGVLNLATGEVVDHFTATRGSRVTFTLPEGLALLDLSTAAAPQGTGVVYTLQRDSLSGTVQVTYPSTFSQVGEFTGSFLETPDGTEILMAGARGLALVRNDGSVASQFTIPGATTCTLPRWWAPTVALASCTTASSPGIGPHLYEVPISGAPATTLTAVPAPPDLGESDAVQTTSGVYTQSIAGCGPGYLGKLNPDGSTARVTVPDTTKTYGVVLLGTDGIRLALEATVSCDPGISVVWYDPVTNTTTVVLGPAVNGGNVQNAIAYRSETP